VRTTFVSLSLACVLAACTSNNPDFGGGSEADLGGSGGGVGDLGANSRADLASSQASPYDSDGTASVTKTSMTAGNFPIDVYVPSTPGARPVVILSAGFFQPGRAYAPYATRLASHGVIAITRDDPGLGAQASQLAADIAMLVGTWLPAQNAGGPLAGRIDLTKIGLAGHSRGGQASILAATGAAKGKVVAFFGLDPVDSAPPFGGGMATLARTGLPTIGIPTVFLGETTNAMAPSGGIPGLSMACAPAADNYAMLYGLAPSPSVKLTALGADHTQFEDPASCSNCNQCMPKGTTPTATVLRYSVRYLTAFFARELLGDATVGAALDGAGVPADVAANLISVEHK
jgi:dienelactone hydrolase